jgi:hypothetical protein
MADAAASPGVPAGVRVLEEDGGRVVLEVRPRGGLPPGALTLLLLMAALWLVLRSGDVSLPRVWVPAAVLAVFAASAAARVAAGARRRTVVAADAVTVEARERPVAAFAVLLPSATLRAIRVEAASGRRGIVSLVAETADGARHLLVRDAGSPAAAAFAADRLAAAARAEG